MNDTDFGSVSHWIGGLRENESVAAQAIWNRYFEQLVGVAQRRLRSLNREASGEDVALSALKSVMVGLRDGKFPELTDREGLWPLLVTITARKSSSQVRHQLALMRNANRQVCLHDLEVFLGATSTEEFAVEFADVLEHLVTSMGDERLRLILQRRLEGYSLIEIAQEIGCSKRTIQRKLDLVRQEWGQELADDGDDSKEG